MGERRSDQSWMEMLSEGSIIGKHVTIFSLFLAVSLRSQNSERGIVEKESCQSGHKSRTLPYKGRGSGALVVIRVSSVVQVRFLQPQKVYIS